VLVLAAALALPAHGALGAGPCHTGPAHERARVAHVFDGDTLRLADGRHLRLIGVDTPEMGRDGEPPEPYAEAARAALARLAAPGTRIALVYGPERRDPYRRLLAHVRLDQGPSAQVHLLQHGLATVIVVPPNVAHLACYLDVERHARARRVGLWSLRRYRPVAATGLARGARGFRLVHGRVQRVGESASAVWLNLTADFALRIPRADLGHFRTPLSALQGASVQARGWVYRRGGELRMTVRHPLALELESPPKD